MFVTFMPLYIRSQGMATGEVGMVFATQALANALSRLPSGKLCDRLSDRSVLVTGGLSLFAMAVASFGFCHSVTSLMAVAAVMGMSMGVAFTVVCALIADSVPRQLRGLAMGCYNTSVYAGMMLCSIFMGGVIRGKGYGFGFLMTGLAVLIVMLVFRFLYRRTATGGVADA
jgi:MFS transporter, DHA1 family, multidrug resistance protein